jgi:hypothetical protein
LIGADALDREIVADADMEVRRSAAAVASVRA